MQELHHKQRLDLGHADRDEVDVGPEDGDEVVVGGGYVQPPEVLGGELTDPTHVSPAKLSLGVSQEQGVRYHGI